MTLKGVALTLDTTLEQFRITTLVQGNQQCTAPNCRWPGESDHQDNGQPLVLSYLLSMGRKFEPNTYGKLAERSAGILVASPGACLLLVVV